MLARMIPMMMAMTFCFNLHAESGMVADSIITMRVDTIVVQKIPYYLGKTISVTYYTLEEYAKKTGRPPSPTTIVTLYIIYTATPSS